MADLFGNILAGATVEVETAISPPVRIPVDGITADTGGPGLFTRLLRPVVVVRRGETVLLRIEPAGTPNRAAQTIAAVFLVTLISWVIFRVVGRR